MSAALALIAAAQAVLAPVEGATRIIDGDTLAIEGLEPSIRLFGIDAPEKGEPGGAEATAFLKGLVHGAEIRCQPTGVDPHRRLVARCERGGMDLGRALIEAGYAVEWCRDSAGFYGTCTD